MYEKVLEVKGTAKGAIRRIMPDIGFGAIWDKKNNQDVYFFSKTPIFRFWNVFCLHSNRLQNN